MRLTDYPAAVFVVAFLVLWLAAWFGASVLRKRRSLTGEVRDDFGVIVAATLTLLGLIIGFSFSMATGRYDQRKNLEEEEANAIGTEYLRAELLPAVDAAKVKALLVDYTGQRILFYTTRDSEVLAAAGTRTAQLQDELWKAVRGPAAALPTPLSALAVAGMNDVLNAQGYTQAAWWNRIPHAAWGLMAIIAIFCNVMVGFGMRDIRAEGFLLTILPLVVAISFFLIADIDSPRAGVIRVAPQNLLSLAESLRPR
jgi:hypothetical protein